MATPWDLIIGSVSSIIDKIIPDPVKAAEMKLAMFEAQQRGDLAALQAEVQLAVGQMEINKVEAASPDNFRAGWRPAVGWVCVFGLGYTYLARPLLPWFAAVVGLSVPELPAIDLGELVVLLGGLLGLGGLRTIERVRGKA
jgi:hypothetical protein